jgi:3-deoxy-D-manno-octulosonate 8-phosphate phosphatase (KDO 8-P phosphatase)
MKAGKMDLQVVLFVAFDFDGVFTNNLVYVSQDGLETVRCHRSDGLGLQRLAEVDVDCMILSTEVNHVVGVRAAKMKIACRQGLDDKLMALDEERLRRGLAWEQVAYLGNDINDADCLKAVGLPVVVADAYDEVRPLARLILQRKGGEGAVRELCDLVWRAKRSPPPTSLEGTENTE